MDTELLRTFLEVKQTRHFARAAENLYVTQAAVGSNLKLANGANNVGSSANGNSKVGVDSTEGTTSTWPIRVVDVVPETALAGNPGSYTEVIVKWNQRTHSYLNPTGLA